MSDYRQARRGRSFSVRVPIALLGVLVATIAGLPADAATYASNPPAPPPAMYPATATQSNTACATPIGSVVHAFQVSSSGSAPADIVVFVAGSPGTAPMCIQPSGRSAVAVPAHNRPLAYLYAEISKAGGYWRLWGAVPNSVHRITVTVDGGVAQQFVV